MSLFRKKKKRKKKVEYEELGKGEARLLRIGETYIVAMRLPGKKRLEVEGEAGIPLKARGKYGRDETAEWHVFIHSKDAPLMPLDVRKKTVAETISTTTSTKVTSRSIRVHANKELKYIYDKTGGYCWYCGEKLDWEGFGKPGKRGSWELNHRLPLSKGGTVSLENLVPTHIACHRRNEGLASREPKSD